MRRPTTAAARPWQVTLILTIFGVAVAAAAVAGWWYARESTPHQGPILLISVDGLRPDALQAYGGSGAAKPGLDALATDAVVFEHAYAHSPLTLPSHASMLVGQLPFEHGVRDEAGFALDDEAESLPELLRSRGFETGAAVSSFLLRPESGVAQGFSFFDAELPQAEDADQMPIVERDGALTTEAAERWLRARRGNRFFLFIQVEEDAADETVARLTAELKARQLYDQATIILTADHAGASARSLEDEVLHVPLLVKQPDAEGAGRRVALRVQHIDLLPTILDLVRAPIPSGLRGRSLRAILDGDRESLADPLIYAESLAPRFRFGGSGRVALAGPDDRYIRADTEGPDTPEPIAAGNGALERTDAIDLPAELDRLLEGHDVAVPDAIEAAAEDRFAMLGYLGGSMLAGPGAPQLEGDDEAWVDETQRAAAMLAARKEYIAAIGRLRDILRIHPRLPVIQYQLAMLLERVGRRDEAERMLGAAGALEPDNPYVPMALAELRLRAGRPDGARDAAALAVALAERHDARARAAAHEVAALASLALDDPAASEMHADAAERDDPRVPMRAFVRGRLLSAEGRYEDAREAFEEAVERLKEHGGALEELHRNLGETLARLEQFDAAEEQFRAELRVFPRSIRAYSSLALLHRASNRTAALEETLDAMVEATRSPEGYETAARLWTIIREPAKAAELRAEARTRFRR
ncbi:MAG: sulfatase-like hydrolase/transferase [Acidobacteria bacterium]|nr:sulfatase-like hydrolase/transferase [Acidobacteriota bacterium]